jgi:DNA-binding NtrC family response regulator
MLNTVVRCLKREQIEIRSKLSASEALGWISSEEVAVLVSDYDMPEMTGAQLAGHARRVRPETVRILLTGKRTLETAIDGINQGEIFKFLNKPFDSEQLRGAVRAGVQRNRELLEMSGDRQRRERREALRAALEAEYPGISQVARHGSEPYAVTADPWSEASELGLPGLSSTLEDKS